MDVSFFIAQRLRSKKHGSFSAQVTRIAIGSIAIGMASLIIAVFIYQGFTEVIQQKLFSHAGHLTLNKFDLNNSIEESPVLFNESFMKRTLQVEGVKSVNSYAHKAGLLKNEEEVSGIVLKGLGKTFDQARFENYLVQGRLPDLQSDTVALELAISQQLSRKLELELDQEAILIFMMDKPRFRKMKVAGIYHTGIQEFDEAVLFGDLQLIQQLNSWGDSLVGGYEVMVADIDQIDPVSDAIYELMDFDLMLFKITDRYVQYFDWFMLLRQNVNLFLFIILAVVAFNIGAVILIMIMERTSMIGSLKAFGATNRQIGKIFVYNGLRLTLAGLLTGNLLGLGLSWLQQQFKLISLNPENYYMEYVPITYNWLAVFGLNLIILLVITGVLVIPTFFISRVDPVKSIKFS